MFIEDPAGPLTRSIDCVALIGPYADRWDSWRTSWNVIPSSAVVPFGESGDTAPTNPNESRSHRVAILIGLPHPRLVRMSSMADLVGVQIQ
jgi:hypothetical protein